MKKLEDAFQGDCSTLEAAHAEQIYNTQGMARAEAKERHHQERIELYQYWMARALVRLADGPQNVEPDPSVEPPEYCERCRAVEMANAKAHGTDAPERQAKCMFCRMGAPMSETRPEHTWWDDATQRVVTVPCYYDLDAEDASTRNLGGSRT